jgi:adenylate kinase family enzyme
VTSPTGGTRLRGFVVVSGPPASGKSTLAPALAAALDLPLEDALDEVVLAHLACAVQVEVAADLDQFLDVLALEFVDVHGSLVGSCAPPVG